MKIKIITRFFTFLLLMLFAMFSINLTFAGDDVKGKRTSAQKTYTNTSTTNVTTGGKYGDSYRLNINNINLPLNRRGVIADVNIPPTGTTGRYDGIGFLFSSGFLLSGYSGDKLWANAMASASLVQDYIQGTVAGGSADPNAVMYVLKRTDPAFGPAWQDWKDAVALGADFYDGDGDGVYNPVDLDGDGVWGPNEDAPDLLGDETVWCVYNDGVAAAQRRWNAVDPIGIEIRQTVFALASKGSIGNMIFLRYRLKYVGRGAADEPEKLDSVYFAAWADPDVGESYQTDLVGSDVQRNAIYTYKAGSDPLFGSTPPAFFVTFFSGPLEYIPGETFVDVNGNGEYDDGTDTPLDTAYSVRGQIIGKVAFPGARNQPLSSVVEYLNGFDQRYNDPDNHTAARNFMLGLERDGSPVDPCTLPIGEVRGGVDCSTVDPRFWFSGDPVTNVGWIGTQPWDVRQMSNTGPFTLYKDTEANRLAGRMIEKEVVVAYVVGRGTSNLNSITVARNINDVSQEIFDNNFPSPPPPPPVSYETQTGDNFINITWNTSDHIKYRALDPVLDFDRRVQGFYVNALRTNSKSLDVNGVLNSIEIANYSLNNIIHDIYYTAPNGGVDLRRAASSNLLDSAVYADPTQGRIRLSITEDPFTGGPLVKGKEYYFAITQYTINHTSVLNRSTGTYGPPGDYIEVGSAYEEFDFLLPTQNKHATQTAIIRVVFGEDIYSPSFSPNSGTKVSGASDGEIKYLIVNNSELTGNDYSIEFFKDNAAPANSPYLPFWRLKNNNTGVTLIDSSKVYNFDTTSYAGKVIEGFIPKVKPVEPSIGLDNVTYVDAARWYTNFRPDSSTGVYYVGQDIPQGGPLVVSGTSTNRSSAISVDRLRTIEIRFNESGKAYRYLNGFIGTPITRRQSAVYAEGVTAADTGTGKGQVGMLGQGFVDVPFTAWVVDEKYGEEKQLAVGFIELSSPLGGNPDGVWDPGTVSTPLGNEVILIFDADYDPNGGHIQYKGNSNAWADALRGFALNDNNATADEIKIASSQYFNSMYVVGLKKSSSTTTITPGKLRIPMNVYPYTNSDVFTFKTLTQGQLSADEKKALFEKVNVFPNPLYGFNPATSYTNSPSDEPFVTFSNLPENVTIKIFTLSGTLIRTLGTGDKSTAASPFLRWDLQNENGLRVASGLYLAIVSSPEYGEKVLKFSIIMPQKQLQRY